MKDVLELEKVLVNLESVQSINKSATLNYNCIGMIYNLKGFRNHNTMKLIEIEKKHCDFDFVIVFVARGDC